MQKGKRVGETASYDTDRLSHFMQTVNTEPTTTPARLSPRNLPPWARWILLAVLGIIVMLAVVLLTFRLVRQGVLPGTSLADIDVGHLSYDELTVLVEDLSIERRETPLTLSLQDAEISAPAQEAGYTFDVDTTVAQVWERGRQANPLYALGDHVRSLWDDTNIRPTFSVDDTALATFVSDAAASLRREPVEGVASFDGDEVNHSDPVAGVAVVEGELATEVRDAILAPGEDAFESPHEILDPMSTVDDIEAIVAEAQRAVSAPIELVRNDGVITYEPEELGELLEITSDFSSNSATYAITAEVDTVMATVSEEDIAAFEADPASATFSLTSDGMKINPSTDGFVFEPETMTEQLLSVIAEAADEDGLRRAELDGAVTEPDRTTEEAEALEIIEPVASFTTEHKCCQSRVTNIHRFADIMRGQVVEPGETISLNGVVGERTKAKGFVAGGAIFKGEYIDDVGGGVSQFATTFFNAAFFGGYEIVEHKPHSYYISRYPVGRESTIDFPGVDVQVKNNSPYGMYVHTSYSSTAITVTLYGKKWVDVKSSTGDQFRFRQPETEVEINRALAPGTERVTQSGKNGFDIVVTRTLTLPDEEPTTQKFFTRYLPEPRIIERNPAPPTASAPASEAASAPASEAASAPASGAADDPDS